MENLLSCELRLIDNKVKFEGSVRDNPGIVIDYFPPLGSGEGYTSLELLLMSVASCISTTLKAIIVCKYSKSVNGMFITVSGERRIEHPTSLKNIDIHIRVNSEDINKDMLTEISDYAIHNLCPVTDMLSTRVAINTEFTIVSSSKGVVNEY